MIDEFVTVASVDEIPSGAAKTVTVGSYEVAIFHVGDEWYAIEGVCPHQGGPLAEGWVHEKTVTCPWHAWSFSLETGRLVLHDMDGVATFDVRVERGWIAVNAQPRGSVQQSVSQVSDGAGTGSEHGDAQSFEDLGQRPNDFLSGPRRRLQEG